MTFLEETTYFDYRHPKVKELIAEIEANHVTAIEKAKAIYLRVRDGWRYNAYQISLNPLNYKASTIMAKSEGHCIEKAIILIGCLRGMKIPARLRLAKVTNHIAAERLIARFGSNILTPHGMVDIFLEGKWVKATPAFNAELCKLCKVLPLEFDGKQDAIFQEYNADGDKFMEYLEDYGAFGDVPLDFMIENLRAHYPRVFHGDNTKVEYRF